MSDERDIEEIKKRKMQELLQQYEGGSSERDGREEQHKMQRAALLRQIMTPEARERLARLRMAQPDIVEAVEQQLLGLYQSGRLRGMVDDATLVSLLDRLMPKKKDIKIERR